MAWEDLTPLEQSQAIYSDFYKDVYGSRPRGINTDNWTLEEFDREFERLAILLGEKSMREAEMEREAIIKFEANVASLITETSTREKVVAWLMDAQEVNGDTEYFCFLNGLPYGYFNRRVDA